MTVTVMNPFLLSKMSVCLKCLYVTQHLFHI